MIFAIEGIDGAGKATTAALVDEILRSRGLSVFRASFPQYGRTLASGLIQQLLNSEARDFSAYYYATVFALDRSEAIKGFANADVVLCDRYVASNLAFQLARQPQSDWHRLADWIEDFEFNRLKLPKPCLNFLLDIPVELAETLIRMKGSRDYTAHEFDQFERDREYQQKVSRAYEWLSQHERCGAWARISMAQGSRLRAPADIATSVADLISSRLVHA